MLRSTLASLSLVLVMYKSQVWLAKPDRASILRATHGFVPQRFAATTSPNLNAPALRELAMCHDVAWMDGAIGLRHTKICRN